MDHDRYLRNIIAETIKKKMVFIGGPRQVGKTTLSLDFINPKSVKNPAYLNWDRTTDKSAILRDQIPLQSKCIILDEIHKYKKWRNLIKGIYDKYKEDHQFIITGSAKLDLFRKGGDSLMGRYRYYRLHPFTLPEYDSKLSNSSVQKLLKFGGFPEPLFAENEDEHRLWQKERMQKVVLEDIRDLEDVKDISTMLLLAELIPGKVGSPLSLKSLEEDLQVSQPTIARWVNIFGIMYYSYLIAPYGAPKIRAVKKLQKIYLWDWSQVEDAGARFENFVAGHLYKYCHYIEDTQGHNMELRYLRDTDGREIDFVVLKNKKPIFAVECKTGDKGLSSHIKYFKERTKIPSFYQVHLGVRDYGDAASGRVLSFSTFCKELNLV
jgi:predicted AAA+ superfamily ATPase